MRLRVSSKLGLYIYRSLPLIIVFAVSLVMISIIILISGFNPLDVFGGLLRGGFGSLSSFGQAIDQATPLLLCSLGLILVYKAGIWNIGAEGQLYMGAVGALIGGYYVPSIPGPLQILLMVILAFISGAIWAAIPGYFRARFNTNEVIVSLLMVFIAQWMVSYFVRFPFRSDTAVGFPVSETIWKTSRLPQLPGGIDAHAGIIIALVLTVIVWAILQKSVYGYRIKAVGVNADAALYGGIPVSKMIISSMILSGGLAGVAGMVQVSGVYHVLAENISVNYGFLAIVVVFIGRLHPAGAVIMSIFLGGLLSGSHYVQASLGLDVTVVHLLVAIIMLAFVLQPFIEQRLNKLLAIHQD
jgi:ABC-type uncharacterized transport system permease subunit